MKSHGPESNADYEYPVQEVSEKSINKQPRDHLVIYWQKKCDCFVSLSKKIFPEGKLKSLGINGFGRGDFKTA